MKSFIPGAGGENTHCYRCGALLIERYGFFVRANRIRDGRCPECETPIDGIGLTPTSAVEGSGAMINDDVR